MRRLANGALFAASLLFALSGVTLLLGLGGDNGQRADHIEIGGRHIGTYTAGAVSVAVAVVVAAAAFVGSRRRSR